MAKKSNLTKEQIDSIKAYSDDIVSLKDFTEMVRQAKGMYIGYLGNLGFERMFREVFQNAIDEMMRPNSPCDHVRVTYDERTRTAIVEDNGRGIPFGDITRVFTKQHTSSNYNKKVSGSFTSGVNGVGAKVTNALSEKFVVESYILGEGRRVEFDEGYPWKKGEVKIPNNGKQGTIVLFKPSSVMGEVTTSADDILKIIEGISPLTNIGSKIYYTAIFQDGTKSELTIVNEDGIMGILMDMTIKPFIKPIVFGASADSMNFNAYITYALPEEAADYQIKSYANFCPTNSDKSSHVKGFLAGFKKFIITYMNKVFLKSANGNGKRKKPLTVTEADVKNGLIGVIVANHLQPNFTGQAKDEFAMDDVEAFVKDQTYSYFENEWSRKNPNDLLKLCKYLKDMAALRMSMDDKKVKLSNQYNAAPQGYPSKFIKPTKQWKELFICEGDSAGGSIENHRVNEYQGVFPIRGMIINCFDNTEKKCLENAEVAGILQILGGGYGKNFDISKVPWEKVIIASDADNAGAFIASLLLRMVLKFCPQLIEEGRFYRAIPPLYYVDLGKKKGKIYFTNKVDLVQYIQKEFTKLNTIETLKGKKLTAREVQELLYNNIDYIYEIDKIAGRYRVDPHILEIYLNHLNESPDKICKLIKKKYRFMEQVKIDGHITCDGIANGVSNTLIMNDRMIHECKNIIDINKGNLYDKYLLNGEEVSIYDIMIAYKKCEPKGLMRLKGLGEQDPDELAESVIYPGDMGNRVLMKYTMESAKKEIETIREFESNKNLLLKDLVVTRMDITD